MHRTASTLAAAALTFWALVALADRPARQPIQQQPAPRPAAVVPEPWQHPDPRTISRFPGP